MVVLLHAGRCYKAEICTILLPLRCALAWYDFLPKSTFSFSGRKPWTIGRRFDLVSFRTHNSSLEGDMELIFAPFCSALVAIFDKGRVPLYFRFPSLDTGFILHLQIS